MQEKPFDFNLVKVVIKKGDKGEDKEILLNKKWTYDNIKHFRPVIEGVTNDEGIEITLTCNLEAFQFIVEYLKAEEDSPREKLFDKVNFENCLNILVTADFLKLDVVYDAIWYDYFEANFANVIDKCQLNLTSICQRVVTDVAQKITLESLLELKDRGDKFISNVFRHRIDLLLRKVDFY